MKLLTSLVRRYITRHTNTGECLEYNYCGHILNHRGTKADLGVIRQIFNDKDYDLARLRRYQEIDMFYNNCKNPLIVDAGANIGASSIWFSKNYLNSYVTAIEPHPGNFQYLDKNCRGLNVRTVNGAIDAVSGKLNLLDPGEGEWGYRTSAKNENCVCEVDAFSIDELIGTDETPFILKVDIEGGEDSLFSNHWDVLNSFPVVIVELHDWMLPRQRSSLSFLRWHTNFDRDFIYINENVFSLSNNLLPKL